MTTRQQSFEVRTSGRGTTEVTDRVQAIVREAGVDVGLCHVFNHHTSASLILCENADPTVRRDLEDFFGHLAPDGSHYHHAAEGPDDMAAHLRTVLTTSGLTVPISGGRCALGTWQGIYLWEHRSHPHRRRLTVTILG